MKILVVDDEALIREVIKEYLSLEGYEVDEASNGEEAVKKAFENDYSLIIMDIMMPKMDGYQACKEIKKNNSNIPFIMLSARSEEYDKLIGFDLGIDDYVTKPFSPKELVARVKAVIKRTNGDDNNMSYGLLQINDKAHDVLVNGEKVYLSPKEYAEAMILYEDIKKSFSTYHCNHINSFMTNVSSKPTSIEELNDDEE